jgi:hypothetical protein
MPARTYNIVVNHRRMILSTTAGHPSCWHDQTITLFDKFIQAIRHNKIISDHRFSLLQKDNNGAIVEQHYEVAGYYVTMDTLDGLCLYHQ